MHPRAGMRLFLHDSASRGNVPFVPADPERVRIYTCGPTVYRYAHIGNLRTYLLTDLLVRTLRFLGYGTFAVQNITDMGHMHQEQLEAGEDKVIAAARAAGKSAREIARFFTEAFFRDCRADGVPAGRRLPEGLGARPGDDRARARARGTGRRLRGGRVPLLRRDEGARATGSSPGPRLGEGTPAERTDEGIHRHKRRPEDFTLWMPAEPGREFQWESRWGRGWPGWHIECAAMAIKYLGPEFDVHVGGVGPPLPAPRELPGGGDDRDGEAVRARSGCTRRTCWSTGRRCRSPPGTNTRSTISGRRPRPGGKGYSPADFRYYCLTLHYSSPMNFTWEGQEAAARARSRLQAAFRQAALQATSGEDAAAALRDGVPRRDLGRPEHAARPRRGPQGGPVRGSAGTRPGRWRRSGTRSSAWAALRSGRRARRPASAKESRRGSRPIVEAMARERETSRRARDYRRGGRAARADPRGGVRCRGRGGGNRGSSENPQAETPGR